MLSSCYIISVEENSFANINICIWVVELIRFLLSKMTWVQLKFLTCTFFHFLCQLDVDSQSWICMFIYLLHRSVWSHESKPEFHWKSNSNRSSRMKMQLIEKEMRVNSKILREGISILMGKLMPFLSCENFITLLLLM